jgi:hypothetical protein
MHGRTLRRLLTLLSGACLGVGVWWLFFHRAAPQGHAPTSVASSTQAPLALPAPIPASVAPARPDTDFEAEAVLRELEPLAVHDKPRALALALDADARLPAAGVFAEARRALIVTLLVDLQRTAEARDRAREFTRNYQKSRYLPLVQGVTGFHPRPRPSELRDARR